MAVHAAFTEEMSGLQDRDDGFLALFGQDSQLDLAFLNLEHRVRDFALLEHVLVLVKFKDRLPGPHFGEKTLGVKHVFWRLSHRSLLWLDQRDPLSPAA
jgi:hypothetical protein